MGAGLASTVCVLALATPPAVAMGAERQPVAATTDGNTAAALERVDPKAADATLGKGWATSQDKLITLISRPEGLDVVEASEADGYKAHVIASLGDASIETDGWVGNYCLTESAQRVIVTYAPRQSVSDPVLSQRGGSVATIDLATGHTTELENRSSLAYFSPGCGRGEQFTLTETIGNELSAEKTESRLTTIDATTSKTVSQLTLPGEITSAVPDGTGAVVAAAGSVLLRLREGQTSQKLTTTDAVASNLVLDAGGGLTYLDHVADRSSVRYLSPAAAGKTQNSRVLADGPLTSLDLHRGTAGNALIVGKATKRSAFPASVKIATSDPDVTDVSSLGHAAVPRESTPVLKADQSNLAQWEQDMKDLAKTRSSDTSTLPLASLVTGKTWRLRVTDDVAGDVTEAQEAPQRQTKVAAATAPASNSTTDSGAWCSIPRNDPNIQVYQPTPRQVEWAVDQAVTGNLTKLNRPANWKQSGMPSAWTPQGMFPSVPLTGGGRVPAQIVLGITAQESNMWQASGHALSGVSGNPLVGNFYGGKSSESGNAIKWNVDYKTADCGYGIMQVTDGMRMQGHAKDGETLLAPTQQRAVAVDYATNIAAGLQILQSKWNQTKAAGLVMNDGNPQSIENWYFALWAYNTGFYPQGTSGQPWGVGWLNNPINPRYRANRELFNKYGSDPSHPQDWPYQEKVIGFAAYPITTLDGAGYRNAWWTTESGRDLAQPKASNFCSPAVDCYVGEQYKPTEPSVSDQLSGPCAHKNSAGQYDLKCWWHSAVTYTSCPGNCGHELLRFDSTYPEQPDGTHNPPNCSTTGLPAGSLVIDDVPATAPPISTTTRPCSTPAASAGSFALTFPDDGTGNYSSRVDFHQVGLGYGGHLWFAHTRTSDAQALRVSGTWSWNTASTQWARVMVHLPDVGADTQQAKYVIDPGDGKVVTRYLPQRIQKNAWVSLGVVQLKGKPKLTLASDTLDGRGADDVAWDAAAITPLSSKPTDFVVALGDSYTSGEGAADSTGSDYYPETNYGGDLTPATGKNACHRSKQAWPRKMTLADSASSVGARADALDPTMDFQFHACSGAKTENVNPTVSALTKQPMTNAFGRVTEAQWGEMPQLDQGYLDANTTLVVMSLGGNDARFSDIIQQCIVGLLKTCPAATLEGDTQPLSTAEPARIRGAVRTSLIQTLREVHAKAPNAKILLMGYPKLLEKDGSCLPAIEAGEGSWMNTMSTQEMAPMMRDVVSTLKTQDGVSIAFGDPLSDFEGRGACGDPESINALVLNHATSDSSGEPVSKQSLHPNIAGTTLYANAANRSLRNPLGL